MMGSKFLSLELPVTVTSSSLNRFQNIGCQMNALISIKIITTKFYSSRSFYCPGWEICCVACSKGRKKQPNSTY